MVEWKSFWRKHIYLRVQRRKFFFEEREQILSIFILGLVVRISIAPYITFITLQDWIKTIEYLYTIGFQTFAHGTTIGPGFHLFYTPVYVPFIFANYFGFHQPFILNLLFKIPGIVGDSLTFYSLYNIVLTISKNRKISLISATLFFLNPFVIIHTLIGMADSIAIGFTMLSFLYLLRRKFIPSAVCLSIGTSIRFLSLLLLPIYLIYIVRTKGRSTLKLFSAFSASSLALFSPWLFTLISKYLSAPSEFLEMAEMWFVGGFLGGFSGGFVRVLPHMENVPALTGLIYRLGFWNTLNGIAQNHTFLLLFVPLYLSTLILLLTRPFSERLTILSVVVTLSLVVIARSISYPDLLLWVFPFLIIAAYLFLDIPKYYLAIIWIPTFISGYFTYNPAYHFINTIPIGLISWWPNNPGLHLTMTVIYSLFIVAILVQCFFRILGTPKQGSQVRIPNPKFDLTVYLLIFFYTLYCILEIIRSSFALEIGFGNTIFGGVIIFLVFGLMYKNRRYIMECKPILSTGLSKAMALVHIGSLIAVLYFITTFHLDTMNFLLIQMIILGFFWIFNKLFKFGLIIQRIAFVFTAVYLVGFLFIPIWSSVMDSFMRFSMLLYLFTWFYLLIKTEYATGWLTSY